MNYSRHENNTLLYVASFLNTSDFKIIAPLIRKEYENIRSVKAYITRLYFIKNKFEPMINRNKEFMELNLEYDLLKSALKPIEFKKNININLVKAEFEHYKIEVNKKFSQYKKTIEEQKKIIELQNEKQKPILKIKTNLIKEKDEEKKIKIPKPILKTNKNFRKEKDEEKKIEISKPTKKSITKYKIKYNKTNNSYFCECNNWKYQHIATVFRTCKHIRNKIGDNKEFNRIKSNLSNKRFENYKKPYQIFKTISQKQPIFLRIEEKKYTL